MSPAATATAAPVPPPDPDRPAVLYVDDEEQALKYFRRGLDKEFRVLVANGADAALAILDAEAGRVGVVISDQRMPGRTGVSLLAEVRQRWPAAVRLLITAYTDIDSAVSAVNAGAVYKYVHKPADFPALKLVLADAMTVHRETVHRDAMARTLAELERQRRATEAAEADRNAAEADRNAAEADRAKLHQQLVAASREAGRAEVATGILHNVGNVLNSMTVSAGLVQATLRDSRVGNLVKGLAMIGEHAGDPAALAAFLTADDRGRRLPEYLSKVAGVLVDEQRAIADAAASLARNIEHVTQVVKSQQAHAKHVVIRDRVCPAALMAEAVRLAQPQIDQYGVTVTRSFPDAGTLLSLDQHRVLQILTNLVANAVHAVAEGRPAARAIAVRVGAGSADDGRPRVALEVTDNGVGIAAENLTRMFTFGFTTRADGHGFGLHSAANAAREMGGSLTATSGGPGTGATFRLELPVDEDGSGAVAPPAGTITGGKARAA